MKEVIETLIGVPLHLITLLKVIIEIFREIDFRRK